LDAVAHEQGWGAKVDWPSFGRVKYCDYGIDNCNLFAKVFVMRHQMLCSWFPCLSSRFTHGLLEPKKLPSRE
jgi:hypothetical protein